LLAAGAFLGQPLSPQLFLLLRPLFGFLPRMVLGLLLGPLLLLVLWRRRGVLPFSLSPMAGAIRISISGRTILRRSVLAGLCGNDRLGPKQGKAQAKNQCLESRRTHSVVPRSIPNREERTAGHPGRFPAQFSRRGRAVQMRRQVRNSGPDANKRLG
ncbi:MAG: hypothetical protein WBP72_17685, partial [Rhodocyclaceae bacterium]